MALPFWKGALIKGERVNAFSQQLFLERLKKSSSELEGSADALVWRKGGMQTATAGTSTALGPLLLNLYGVGR